MSDPDDYWARFDEWLASDWPEPTGTSDELGPEITDEGTEAHADSSEAR